MSNRNRKKFGWGGKREGAGRPEGFGEKTKICVSVNEENWHAALAKWQDKGSRLVDALISDYVKKKKVSLPLGAS